MLLHGHAKKFVRCFHWRIGEGCWVVSPGYLVYVDVHGRSVMSGMAATELLLRMADTVCLVCRSCEVHE